jgi:hypothetical protein
VLIIVKETLTGGVGGLAFRVRRSQLTVWRLAFGILGRGFEFEALVEVLGAEPGKLLFAKIQRR